MLQLKCIAAFRNRSYLNRSWGKKRKKQTTRPPESFNILNWSINYCSLLCLMQEVEGNANQASGFDFSSLLLAGTSFKFWITKSREDSCQHLSVNKFTPWNVWSYKYCVKNKKTCLNENKHVDAFATNFYFFCLDTFVYFVKYLNVL